MKRETVNDIINILEKPVIKAIEELQYVLFNADKLPLNTVINRIKKFNFSSKSEACAIVTYQLNMIVKIKRELTPIFKKITTQFPCLSFKEPESPNEEDREINRIFKEDNVKAFIEYLKTYCCSPNTIKIKVNDKTYRAPMASVYYSSDQIFGFLVREGYIQEHDPELLILAVAKRKNNMVNTLLAHGIKQKTGALKASIINWNFDFVNWNYESNQYKPPLHFIKMSGSLQLLRYFTTTRTRHIDVPINKIILSCTGVPLDRLDNSSILIKTQ
jgi:hypothetical protein